MWLGDVDGGEIDKRKIEKLQLNKGKSYRSSHRVPVGILTRDERVPLFPVGASNRD